MRDVSPGAGQGGGRGRARGRGPGPCLSRRWGRAGMRRGRCRARCSAGRWRCSAPCPCARRFWPPPSRAPGWTQVGPAAGGPGGSLGGSAGLEHPGQGCGRSPVGCAGERGKGRGARPGPPGLCGDAAAVPGRGGEGNPRRPGHGAAKNVVRKKSFARGEGRGASPVSCWGLAGPEPLRCPCVTVSLRCPERGVGPSPCGTEQPEFLGFVRGFLGLSHHRIAESQTGLGWRGP